MWVITVIWEEERWVITIMREKGMWVITVTWDEGRVGHNCVVWEELCVGLTMIWMEGRVGSNCHIGGRALGRVSHMIVIGNCMWVITVTCGEGVCIVIGKGGWMDCDHPVGEMVGGPGGV